MSRRSGTVAAAWTALIAATTAVYAPVVTKLVADWWSDPDYSHGLLCAPLAVGIAVARRTELARLAAAPSAIGLAGAGAAMAALGLGILGAELFLTRISLLLFIASTILYVFGWRHLRVLAFPLALLLLSIPIPAIVTTRFTLPLQFAASAMAETSLGTLGIPVLRDGNVLVLPNATLQVAEACSGIRSLVSLIVLALVIARFSERRAPARTAIVCAALPVAVLVNGVRVTVTAAATYWYGTAAAEGVAHEAVGLLAFAVAFTMLLGCARAVNAVHVRHAIGVAP